MSIAKCNICFACLKHPIDSTEHIIPQCIGGWLKANIYCEKCNSLFGRILDNKIDDYFGYFSKTLRIKTERKTRKYHIVEGFNTGIKYLMSGDEIKRKDPIVIIKTEGDKLLSADVTARSEKERDYIIKQLSDKYKFPIEQSRSFVEITPGPVDIKYEFPFDNLIVRREVSKIAYSFICTKLPKNTIFSSAFDDIRRFIMSGNSECLGRLNFTHTSFLSDHRRPLHRIHISLNRPKNMLVGFILLFGIFRYTVLLSRQYFSYLELADMDYTYDPVLRREIYVRELYRAPYLTETQILRPLHTKAQVDYEIDRGMKMLDKYNDLLKYIEPD